MCCEEEQRKCAEEKRVCVNLIFPLIKDLLPQNASFCAICGAKWGVNLIFH